MNLFDKCYNFTRADEVKAAGYYPYFVPIEWSNDTEVIVHGKRKIMIGSNNYLGLTHHPKVLEAANEAMKKYGSGCTGSRFLNGTLDIHIKLEEELADFMEKEAALIFSTGYQTNLGIITTLAGKNDIIFTDKLNHASILDASVYSSAKIVRFRHNDIADLERVLKKENSESGKLIVVDGVFSMEGDIARAPEINKLAKKHNAKFMIDDAHSIGVLGKSGNGTAAHFGLQNEVDIIMGTFSKSFACIGGFVASEHSVINYLKHFARTLIFSASLPPSAVATVRTALQIIKSEPERREQLWRIAKKMKRELNNLGFDTGTSETPIIPVIIGDDMKTFIFWKELFDEGVYSNPVVSPAVPPKSSRLRTSYIATHTDEQLDFVLDKFEKVGKKLGVI